MLSRALLGALCVVGASAALRRTFKDELDSSTTSSGGGGSSGGSTSSGSGGGSSGDYVGCTVNGVAGDCTDASACTSNGGTATPGYCPGPSNIQCCTNSNWGSCSAGGQSGYCTGRDACIAGGSMPLPGACPGPSDIECCVPNNGPSNSSVAALLQFASATWNCDGSSPPCVGCATVPVGSAQTPYGCAPWVAQCLAAGGFLPGLSGGCLDISVFDPYAGYDLNWVGGDGTGLVDYLQAVGWQPTSNIQAGTVCAVFGYDHAVLGVGDGLCAAHNNARWAVGCSDYYGTPDVCLNAP